jgi:phosphomannomutase
MEPYLLNYTLHNAATEAADGTVIKTAGYSTLTVYVTRSAGTSTVKFWGSEDEAKTTPIALMAVNVSTNAVAVSTTGTGEAWQIDVTGIPYFYAELDAVNAEIRAAEEAFGASGRVLVRFSGTEPLARVMVEGPEIGQVDAYAKRIAGAIEKELG